MSDDKPQQRHIPQGARGRLTREFRTGGVNGSPSRTWPAGAEFTMVNPSVDHLDWFAAIVRFDGEEHDTRIGWGIHSHGHAEQLDDDGNVVDRTIHPPTPEEPMPDPTPTEPATYPATWPGAERYAADPGEAPLALLAMPPVDAAESLAGEFINDDGSNADEVARDNQLRAVWASLAVLAYAERTYGSALMTEPISQTINDLLSDMRHLCDAIGLDFLDLACRGGHYEAELTGVF